MFKNILLATDGSRASMFATEKAISLAKLCQETHLTLLHIVDALPESFKKLSFFQKESVAYDQLVRTKELLNKGNVDYTVEVITGDVIQEIISYANSGDYDVLVIGSRGLTALQQYVLGSVSYKVVKKVKIPIFIVKESC